MSLGVSRSMNMSGRFLGCLLVLFASGRWEWLSQSQLPFFVVESWSGVGCCSGDFS